jgi:excisionase family DNA binding protein
MSERDEGVQLLRAHEVAKLLALGRTKVYEMLEAGELPVVRIGTAVRVPRGRLLRWIDANTKGPI